MKNSEVIKCPLIIQWKEVSVCTCYDITGGSAGEK